jgi:hypothetical protein
MKKWTWMATVIFLSSVLFAHAQATPSSVGEFVVGPGEVRVPKGVFLLIRKGHEIGAIRFTSIEPGADVGTGKASYESYFQGDGSSSFRSANVEKQAGSIDLKPLKGLGRASFQIGKDKVEVGKWAFRTGHPGGINMWPCRGSERDYGYEFAPTSARGVEEVDASDKRLRWFRFDRDSSVTLQVADLPK